MEGESIFVGTMGFLLGILLGCTATYALWMSEVKDFRSEAVQAGVARWIDEDQDGVAEGFGWVTEEAE